MLLLNTPVGLSLIDEFVLKHIPPNSRCGIIVNAGTDRLDTAIKEKYGATVAVYNIEERKPLYDLLKNNEFKSADPWDLEWYTKIAQKHGGFDFIFFLNIHEFWHNNLSSLQKILQLLKPGGTGFISFYNKNSLYEIRQCIPPFSVGIEQLGSPMNNWAKLDLTSWMIYLTDIGYSLTDIWGMLEEEAFNYCRESINNKVLWNIKNLEVQINDPSDAYILGAPVMCMRFEKAKSTTLTMPNFLGIQYNASMLQAILFPYLHILLKEIDSFAAHLEADNHYTQEQDSLVLLNFFISHLDNFTDIKKVLVVGCGWGIDLLDLKKIKPDWKITGVDSEPEVIAAGSEIMKKEGIEIASYDENGTFPFPDNSFDLVISLKYFSNIYQPLAKKLAAEMLRVSKQGIAQLEDLRGPEFSMQLKLYSIPDIYTKLGYDSEVRSIKVNEKDSGLYILKVKKEKSL